MITIDQKNPPSYFFVGRENTFSKFFTFWKNVEKSFVTFPLAALFFKAISSMVSWRNLANSSFTLNSFFNLSSC